MQNWTEALPERLAYEVEAFNNTEGLDFELDEDELQATGRVVFRGTLSGERRELLELEVRYPESFPYLRPEVFAPGLQLERHQNPYRHNLCLLERSTRHWSPLETGAWLVSKRVPKLLDLLEGDPEQLRAEEAPQGEPASHYFGSADGTVVFIPEEMLHLPEDQLTGVATLSIGPKEQLGLQLRACLSRVSAIDRHELAQVTGALAHRFNKPALQARWVRLDHFPVDGGTGKDLLDAARAVPGYQPPPQFSFSDGKLRILGLVSKEEVRQGEWEDSWLFAVEITAPPAPQQRRRRGAPPIRAAGRPARDVYVARGERLSPHDLSERIPTLAGMSGKTVAIAGLGALGAPVTLELARGQVGKLHLLDSDRVEAGTIVRWPFGIHAVGHRKTQVLSDYVAADYPFTMVRRFDHHVGIVPLPGEPQEQTETEALTHFLDGADILIDATAEQGIGQLLAALANEAGIPQVYMWATEGGWGGGVARVVPGQTGCWFCLQLRLDEKSIEPPPLAETGTVQPRGCSAPTWTGTSFDALPIVAQAVRTACFTLLGGRANENPLDVFICAQKAESTQELDAPHWTAYPLEPHDGCPYCGAGRN